MTDDATTVHQSQAVDVPSARLGPAVPWPAPGAALAGDPHAAEVEVVDDGRVAIGVWECTPGTYRSTKQGYSEFMHVVAGEATITGDDGTVHEVRPGVAVYLPDGWSGVWEIRQTVRKSYVAITTGS